MPRYWICSRCGTYNLDIVCETCTLSKEEATQFEEIRDSDPSDAELTDQEDFVLTSIFEEEDNDWKIEE